jgi:alkaline phosphatase
MSAMVSHALLSLSTENDKGFFLMVEGSQVDFASHGNDPAYLLSEMRDLEGGIEAALEFASKRNDTLVIVTADHECGSLALRESKPDKRVRVEFMSRNHTYFMVPVFAYGACAELFGGIYDNTEIFTKIMLAAGLDTVESK